MPPICTTESPTPFASAMRDGRDSKGLRLEDAAASVREMLGDGTGPSREYIRRIEVGDVTEGDLDPMYAAALADLYELDLAKIGPAVHERLQNLVRARLHFVGRLASRDELEALLAEMDARECVE